MGVYLSEPNKEKKVNEGYKKGVSYCAVEMQGITSVTQAGEETWKTQTSAPSTLEMVTLSSQSLMATEVILVLCRPRSQQVCRENLCGRT